MADVKALDFALTLRTPKIETKNEEGDDPDAVFLEKMYLIERGYAFFDALYAMFVKLRLTPAWNVELKDFETWLNES